MYKEEFRMSSAPAPIIYGRKLWNNSSENSLYGKSKMEDELHSNKYGSLPTPAPPYNNGRESIEKLPLEKHFNFDTIPVIYESKIEQPESQKDQNWSEEIVYGINV